jgi:isoleucyl-tRNA synthetase
VSLERRSAQTVMWKITEALVRLVAPILSFTAEEVWSYLPKVEGREASVHLALFPKPEVIAAERDETLMADWAELLRVRDEVLKSLEEARKDKRIGKALEAKVRIETGTETGALLARYASALKELLNVSEVELVSGERLTITTLPADGTKCERCWNYRTDTDQYGPWPVVCGRCREQLDMMGYGESRA